jgi:hypothetical protein
MKNNNKIKYLPDISYAGYLLYSIVKYYNTLDEFKDDNINDMIEYLFIKEYIEFGTFNKTINKDYIEMIIHYESNYDHIVGIIYLYIMENIDNKENIKLLSGMSLDSLYGMGNLRESNLFTVDDMYTYFISNYYYYIDNMIKEIKKILYFYF